MGMISKSDTFCVIFRSSLPMYANGEIGFRSGGICKISWNVPILPLLAIVRTSFGYIDSRNISDQLLSIITYSLTHSRISEMQMSIFHPSFLLFALAIMPEEGYVNFLILITSDREIFCGLIT